VLSREGKVYQITGPVSAEPPSGAQVRHWRIPEKKRVEMEKNRSGVFGDQEAFLQSYGPVGHGGM
jgi:hypothetical protein